MDLEVLMEIANEMAEELPVDPACDTPALRDTLYRSFLAKLFDEVLNRMDGAHC